MNGKVDFIYNKQNIIIKNNGGQKMKYEVTNEIIESAGRKLHRIRALVDIITLYGRPVKKGERGGWIEEERNLSQDGNALDIR